MGVETDTTGTDTVAGDETTTDTTTTDETTTTPAVTQADVDKWKALSRQHEAQSKKNAAAAKRMADIDDASATDLERAQGLAAENATKLQAAEARADRALIGAAVMAAATAQGAIDPAAVLQLLAPGSVTIDGDDAVGAMEAVKALLASKPYLVGAKTAKPAGGSSDQGARGAAPLSVTREQLKGMTAQQVAALNPADIARAMSAP